MAINITEDLQGVLMKYEATVYLYCAEHPEIKDPSVIAAFTAAMNFYTRKKKGLPALPSMLNGHSLALFDAIKNASEEMLGNREPDPNVPIEAEATLPEVIIALKRLKESVEKWHKKDGAKGYINFTRPFMEKILADLKGKV